MSELSPEARALVSDGRSILRPTSEDRARVASRLAHRLGAAALLAAQPTYAAPKALSFSKLSSIVVGLGLVTAGATYWLTEPSEPARVEVAAARAPMAPPDAATVVPAKSSPPQAEAAEPAHSPTLAAQSLPRKVPSTDKLAEEVALLSQAASQLRSGNPSGALQRLEEHRRLFPAGRLVEERRAARVQALCAIGNRAEAEAELARLARSSPRSPHLARAQHACGL